MVEELKYQNLKMDERSAIVSSVADLLLTALKMVIGYASGSEALKADGLNNATDIVASYFPGSDPPFDRRLR